MTIVLFVLCIKYALPLLVKLLLWVQTIYIPRDNNKPPQYNPVKQKDTIFQQMTKPIEKKCSTQAQYIRPSVADNYTSVHTQTALKPISYAVETYNTVPDKNKLDVLEVRKEQKREIVLRIARKESNRKILLEVFKIDGGRRHKAYSAYIDSIRTQLESLRKK
jgi:hypothetical protein